MDLDRLKSAWQAHGEFADAPPSVDMKSLMPRLAALERDVQRRDVREYIAACAVMVFFGWRAAASEEMLVRIGCLMVVFGSMFIIVWSRRAYGRVGRTAFAGDLPIAQFCSRELEKVEAQVRLLKTAWWWYVAPTIVGILITLIPGQRALWVRLLVAAIAVGVGALIAWLNWWTAEHELEPLRDELRQRLTELQDPAP